MADLLSRRKASTAATYHKVLKILYAWLVKEGEVAADPTLRMRPPIVPDKPVPIVPDDGLKRLFQRARATASRPSTNRYSTPDRSPA